MKNINNYIIEKFKISKDIKNVNIDLKSFNKWKKYLEENEIEFFEFYKNGGVYALYLKKSNYKYKDTENRWKDKFNVPFLQIAIDDLKGVNNVLGWDFYFYTDGKVEIYTDSNNSDNLTLVSLDKDMDKNTNRLDGIYKFTTKNADFIIDNLNNIYNKCR